MKLDIGQQLPEARFLQMQEDGIKPVTLSNLTTGRSVILFALNGPYTDICSLAHVPSFVRTADQLRTKGVDEILCVAVADPFVMQAWGKETGAEAAGIRMLADADGSFTRSMGMEFDAPVVGFYGRSMRYSLLARDGVITLFNFDDGPGTCELSTGEVMLDQLNT